MYVVDRDVAVTVKDPKIEALNLVAEFSEAFGGTTIVDGVYTYPSGTESWAGFANMNTDLYPMTLEKGAAITFTGSAVAADVDVRFRFERLPFPDVDPAYDTTAVTVTGTTDAEYTICVPAQDAANTYSSFLMYLNTQDAGVKVSNVKVTAYEEAVTECTSSATQSEYTAAMTGVFGGFVYDETTSTYTFAAANEAWAGVANEAADIYPLAFEEAGKITFKASVPDGGTQEVRFRFERLPFPDVDPAYDTAAVTVSGAEEATYEIAVPVQAGLTFSSFLMYLNTRDVPTIVKDVVVTADKASDDSGGGGTTTGSGGGTMVINEPFGGATIGNVSVFVSSNDTRVEGPIYEIPTGSESWAGFAHDPLQTDGFYPIVIPNGATITARMATYLESDPVNVYFGIEPGPNQQPRVNTQQVAVQKVGNSNGNPVYTFDVPAQGTTEFRNFLFYIVENDARVILESVTITPK